MENKTMVKLTNWIFTIMMISFLLFTAPLTVAFLQRILPSNETIPYFGLVLFDGGMFGWLLVYLYKAVGATQRGISWTLTLLSLVGAGILVGGEILQEAEAFLAFDQSLLPPVVTAIIIIWVLINLGAYLIFHLNDPEIRKQNEMSILKSLIFEKAMGQVQNNSKTLSGELAGMMAEVMTEAIVSDVTSEYGNEGAEYEVVKHRRGHKKRKSKSKKARRREKEALRQAELEAQENQNEK